jgi:isoleucyl-tRNA synthetase
VKKFEREAAESVHLAQYPTPGPVDADLVEVFHELFTTFSALAEARNKAGIKLRWPIREAYVKGAKHVERYKELLQYLSNVKEIKVGDCPKDYIGAAEGGVEICLPGKLEPELYYEALARELVRRIQVMRKEMGLEITDMIRIEINTSSDDVKKAAETFKDYLLRETRAVQISLGEAAGGKEWDIAGEKVRIAINKA